jgi:hypothetical protein
MDPRLSIAAGLIACRSELARALLDLAGNEPTPDRVARVAGADRDLRTLTRYAMQQRSEARAG